VIRCSVCHVPPVGSADGWTVRRAPGELYISCPTCEQLIAGHRIADLIVRTGRADLIDQHRETALICGLRLVDALSDPVPLGTMRWDDVMAALDR
jgi:hypothetical protein